MMACLDQALLSMQHAAKETGRKIFMNRMRRLGGA